MLRFFVRLFALIGFLVVAAVVTGVVLAVRHEPSLPDTVVLELDLRDPLAEGSVDRLGSFLGHETTFQEVLDALERGRTDPRVKGVLARFGGDGASFAQVQELRAAVERFRASGRFAIAFAESYGDTGAGNRSYLLASAFDEVWMQPLGLLGLTGLSAQIPFARGALDKLDIQPQVFHSCPPYKHKDAHPALASGAVHMVWPVSGQRASLPPQSGGQDPPLPRTPEAEPKTANCAATTHQRGGPGG
ncbi:S49 family peptidase, partial [Azospirillum brasilense]|uniref:S49 family peptidase n=1 Tax=Azospirillum brasilense TaxID=192 RepID=UPI001FFFD448